MKYLRIWSNSCFNGTQLPKKSMVVKFSSEKSADSFVEKRQSVGGIPHFEADYLGELFEKHCCDVAIYQFGKNNDATARVINRALWGKV